MSDIEDRVVPDLEARVEEVVAAFREQHRNPANLALHAGAWVLMGTGVIKILRGRFFHGAAHIGLALGMLVAGHRIEGNEPFTLLRELREAGFGGE